MKYQYWFTQIPGIGNVKQQSLLIACGGAEAVYYMEEKELSEISHIKQKDVHSIVESRKTWDLDDSYERFLESGIKFVTMEQPEYPRRLTNISQSPYALFYKGELPAEEKRSIAIVGARMCSEYGRYYAKEIATLAVKCDVNVISGMALGIDGASHYGAMQQHGKTYAVLGCGVDYCYPKSNRVLYEYMTTQGGIISEYVPKTAPVARLFPQRNRIISGLSDAVIVIEAKERSGSLITADFAMEQGKDVYALPGRITDALSGGCNRLIKQGAGIITSPKELFGDLAVSCSPMEGMRNLRKIVLEKEEGLVYSVLDLQPKNIEQLCSETKLEIDRLCNVLIGLENAGLIKEVFKNYFIRIHEIN